MSAKVNGSVMASRDLETTSEERAGSDMNKLRDIDGGEEAKGE